MYRKISYIISASKRNDILSEAIMAQAAMNINSIATSSLEKKAYSVTIKGLVAHLVDVLFGKGQVTSTHYTSELSDHLRKDLGLYN
ncbi:hypothetical protein ACU5DF_03195 [Aliivibrio wodanis]|uniref:hypothetical protein n=1 Tax=Aliivibrio wodanis TaxID=80852 RepID=UPI00406CEEC8